MRRIIPHRPTTVVSSFCAAVDGCRATIAATFPIAGDGGGRGRGFLPTDPKPYVRTPHTKPPTDIFGVFVGQSAWVGTARKQLKNEERVRKALGILFRDYGGSAAQDDGLDEDDESDEEDYWEKMAKTKVSEDELNLFLTNLAIECERDHEKYEIVLEVFHRVIAKMNQDDELGDATQNDRVDKLAKIAEEELDAFVTNSFATKLIIECEPKYEKRLREIFEKVRKKMIQDDGILGVLELVTNLMSKCEPEYEKLLCEVLDKVREKTTQDDRDEMGGNENIRKIEKLTKLVMKVGKICSFEEKLDFIVTTTLLWILRDAEKMKPYFMAYEVIEKVAKNVGNENVRKIAEKKLDAIVTHSFVNAIVDVQMNIPYFKFMTWSLVRKLEHEDVYALDGGKVVRGPT